MIIGEYYHLYNRGAHKNLIYKDSQDYDRFLCLLYAANNDRPIQLSWIPKDKRFSYERGNTLVDIVAYCLMPNHFHLAVKEKGIYGTATFIRKVCTGYSMYYNIKYDHSGTIFQGKYKAKPVDKVDYLETLISYIHLNPYGIEKPELTKEVRAEHKDEAIEYSKKYKYSSFKDYLGEKRVERAILQRSDL